MYAFQSCRDRVTGRILLKLIPSFRAPVAVSSGARLYTSRPWLPGRAPSATTSTISTFQIAQFVSNTEHKKMSQQEDSGDVVRQPGEVLDFWFGLTMQQHFGKDDTVDDEIRKKFRHTHLQAKQGRLNSWREELESCLALTIVLDQFSRNMYRGTAGAFENDPLALETSQHALSKGYDKQLPFPRAMFFYLPFMHSEDVEIQKQCVELYRNACETVPAAKGSLDYAIAHLKMIERFGRFPYRNACLGRECTAEETEYLKEPGSSF